MRLRFFMAATAMLAFSLAAHADSISSTAVNTFSIVPSSDTLSFKAVNTTVTPGQSFKLNGTFTVGNSGNLTGTEAFSFADTFTVDGITKTLTFHGNDVVTPGPDTLNIFALGPVTFGNVTLSFGALSVTGAGVIGQVIPVSVTGTLAATPEPSSLALLGTGIFGVIGAARRRFIA